MIESTGQSFPYCCCHKWSKYLVTGQREVQIPELAQSLSQPLIWDHLDLYRTGGPVNTWKIQVLLVLQKVLVALIFFFIYEIPHRGSWTATIRVFISPSAVFIGHRLRAGGFPDVCKLDNHWFGAKPYIWINAIMLVIRQYNPWEETSMKF